MNSQLSRTKNFFRSPLFPIFMIVFVDILGFGITVPVLPLYAQNEFGASAMQITGIATAYFIAQFIASPRLGKLSDRIGRRPVLIISQSGTLIAFLLSGSAIGLPMLYLARIIDGITGGNISVAQAYLSDITEEKDRARGLGIVNAAFSSGFLFGPAFGAGMAAAFGPRAAYFAAAAVSLCTVLLSFFFLPESLTPDRRKKDDDLRASHIAPKNGRLGLLRLPSIALLLSIGFIVNFAFFNFQTTYALWMEKVLFPGANTQYVQASIGTVLTIVGIAGIITQFWLVGPLVRRFGERAMVAGGLVSRSIAWGVMGNVNLFLPALIVTPLISFGGGISQPAMMALLTYASPPGQRGQTIGLAESIQGLGRILGPLAAGLLFEQLSPNAPMLTASLLTCLAALLCIPLWRMEFKPTPSLIRKRDEI